MEQKKRRSDVLAVLYGTASEIDWLAEDALPPRAASTSGKSEIAVRRPHSDMLAPTTPALKVLLGRVQPHVVKKPHWL